MLGSDRVYNSIIFGDIVGVIFFYIFLCLSCIVMLFYSMYKFFFFMFWKRRVFRDIINGDFVIVNFKELGVISDWL